MPLGDIQWTGRDSDVAVDLLKKRIEYGIENNALFLGMGDYIDFASPSNRASLRDSRLYDNARNVIEDSAIALTDHVYKEILAPTKGRWIGLLEGHHFYQLSDGLTTDWVLAQKLGTEHLGWSAFIRIEVKGRKPVIIWCSHGCGSGQTVGSLANRIDKIAQTFDADLYLMGHWTRMTNTPVQRLYVDWETTPSIESRTLHLVGTGGFSPGYVQGSREGMTPRGGYVETALMRPTVLGNPLIRCLPDGEIQVEIQ